MCVARIESIPLFLLNEPISGVDKKPKILPVMKPLTSQISDFIRFIKNRKTLLITIFLLLPVLTSAQFEKKISVNITPGFFKTIGPKDYPDPYGYDYKLPHLMPNFQVGWSINGGIQFNYSRNISFEANLGIARSGFWQYDAYDPDYDDYYCWTCWDIYDDYSDEPIASGQDYLTLFNFSIGFAPKYYFLPSKKINPYALLELNLNFTSVKFIDTWYEEMVNLGMDVADEEDYTEFWLEKSLGLGISPVVGAEFNLSDNIGIFMQTGYWLIVLDKKEFEEPEEEENFHALKFQLGVRMSFWKAKKL